MNTKERVLRFCKERDAYLDECRVEFGYKPRARTMDTNPLAGFISALFGCMLTLYVFSHYDVQPLFSFMKSLQYVSPDDIFNLIASFIQRNL